MRNGDLERLIKFFKVTKLVRGNKGLTAFLVRFYRPNFEAPCYAMSLSQVCLDSLGRVLITFLYYYKILVVQCTKFVHLGGGGSTPVWPVPCHSVGVLQSIAPKR